MQLSRVLKLEDLSLIKSLMDENGFGDVPFEIILPVRSKEILDKINEEYYYKNNKEGTPPDVDEINVSIGNICFKYIVEKGDA